LPYLNLNRGEPWAETLGVMLFPDDEGKRRAYIASLWAGFYPIYEETNAGEPLPRSVLLSVMKASAAVPIEQAELKARRYEGMIAGELFKVLAAIAGSDPRRASWNAASRLVEWGSGQSRALLYQARSRFSSVIHLWAAFILRDQRCHADAARGFTARDDLNVFIAEAMALLQWGTSFRLDRKQAEPVLGRQGDFWIPPPDWEPPTAQPGWPRDGSVAAMTLSPTWLRRIGGKPTKHRGRKPV
jgi:hypothetical protein